MQVSVAVYTFVATIFVIFVLWGTKNLGILGLLSSFSVGIIAYSLGGSLEVAVACIIFSGILLKAVYPYIEKKWAEGYHNYNTDKVIQIIKDSNAKFTHNNAPGLAPKLTEGFQDEAAGAAMAGAPGAAMPGAPGATMAGAPGAAMPGAPGAAMAGAPGAAMPGAPGAAMPDASAGAATNAATTPATTTASIMIPNLTGSGATPVELPTKPSADMSNIEGTNMSTKTGSEPAAALGSAPAAVAQPTMNAGGSPAAAVGTGTRSTLVTGTAPTGAGGAVAGTGVRVAPSGTAGPRMVPPGAGGAVGGTGVRVAPAAGTAPTTTSAFTNLADVGMFKLGQLPSAATNGPHIDAGTTIMRALGALNPDQINSLTEDTRKLVDTQKSLMNMLTTMKPMLSDGQNLLSSFTNMFGKQ